MNALKTKFLLVLVTYMVMAVAGQAQVGGKITGSVKDPSGSVVAGAAVVLTNTQTGNQRIVAEALEGNRQPRREEVALRNHGLGLTSMKERLRLVNGKLSIDSQAQRGTTIHARVPLAS